MLDRLLHNIKKIFDLEDPYTLEIKITFFFLALIMWFLILTIVNIFVRVEKYRPDLKKVECDDIRNRIVSIIHGVYSLFITIYHIYQHNPQYGATISNFQHVIVFTSWAYFVYDMLACVYYRLTSVGLYVHHFLCIFGYLMDELYDRSATDTLMGLFYAEVSNSPMHLRVIVRTLGLKHTKLYELFEFLYFGSYILARGVGIPFVVYSCVVVSVNTPIIVKGVCLGLFIQSSIYIREMILIGKRRYGYYKERVKKGVSLFWLVENPKVKDLSYYGREKKEIIF